MTGGKGQQLSLDELAYAEKLWRPRGKKGLKPKLTTQHYFIKVPRHFVINPC